MTAVWPLPITPNQKLVLLKLADNAHDDGLSARPGVPRIAKLCGLSVRCVQYSLRELEKAGYIAATQFEKGGGRNVTEYRLTLSRGANGACLGVQMTTSPDDAGVQMTTSRGANDDISHKEVVLMNRHETKPPPGAAILRTLAPNDLVSFYVDECKTHGYQPTAQWRAQLGNHAKRILKEKPPDLIRDAIRIMADENKAPGTMAHVIADIEAGRNGNGKPA